MKVFGERELGNKFSEMARKAPDAAAYALTGTAYEIRKQVQQDLPTWLKLTRRFLPQSVIYEKATPQTLTAEVGFAKRANFAKLLEEGGTRKPVGRAIAMPVDVRTSQSGKISQSNRPATVLQKDNVFSKTIDGISGIWQSSKRIPLRLLYRYLPRTIYRTKFMKFYETASSTASKVLPKKFEDAMRRILLK